MRDKLFLVIEQMRIICGYTYNSFKDIFGSHEVSVNTEYNRRAMMMSRDQPGPNYLYFLKLLDPVVRCFVLFVHPIFRNAVIL